MNRNLLDEQSALFADLREHLKFFQELGIELVGRSEAPAVPQVDLTPAAIPAKTEIPTANPTVIRARVKSPMTIASALFETSAAQETLQPSTETFAAIHADIGDCTRCPLFEGRKQVVHTEGNRQARLMFVGEAPGADEDSLGRPFVGRAGQLLTKIIEAIGFKREDVLIGNINRCRPPGNRPPTIEEANVCKPFLLREIAVVQPQVIVVLGNTALHNLINTRVGITKLRGHFQNYKGIRVMPTYHPAYLLRDPSKKRETWEDLKKVRDFLDSHNSSNPD
ncbi:MAG TPA: uracil-DNA glycosylase [Pyrinomonadaceae bacterium]|nr:uracil-DNA glycosylase [Pyrinomonadaceae bacterium]